MRKWRAENRAWLLAYRPKQYAASRRWRQENKEKRLAWLRSYMRRNRISLTERHRQWVNDNPEARRKHWNRWYATHREAWSFHVRNRKLSKVGHVTPGEWREIKASFDHKCFYCGTRPARLTQDHFVPLSKGGVHSAENIVPACQSCNSRKRDLSAEEFKKRCSEMPIARINKSADNPSKSAQLMFQWEHEGTEEPVAAAR